MGLVSLLFSFHGRINRLQYWLGALGVALVGGVILMAVLVSTGLSIAAAQTPAAALEAVATLGVVIIPLSMALSWCGLALQFKRFHDRGRTGFLSFLPMAVMLPMTGTLISGALANAPAEALAASVQPYATALWIINLGFFIDLGCLPSVPGSNKYGDPPGAPGAPAANAPTAAASARSGAPSALLGAQSAIDRAIAERAQQASTPAPAPAPTSRRATGPSVGAAQPASFGRRPAR